MTSSFGLRRFLAVLSLTLTASACSSATESAPPAGGSAGASAAGRSAGGSTGASGGASSGAGIGGGAGVSAGSGGASVGGASVGGASVGGAPAGGVGGAGPGAGGSTQGAGGSLAGAGGDGGGGGAGGGSKEPTVTLMVTPDTVAAGGTLQASVAVTNFILEEAAGQPNQAGHGHYHVYLDGAKGGNYLLAGAKLSVLLKIPASTAPGPHTLRCALSDNGHTPFVPSIETVVAITVQ